MLRRVARVFRVGLFTFGVALIAWLPFSFYWTTLVRFPVPMRGLGIFCTCGEVHLFSFQPAFWWEAKHVAPIAHIRALGRYPFWHRGLVWVRVKKIPGERIMLISIPIWLVSAVCLAWPVTSFIVARRRRKSRGFEVEAKGGSAVSTSGS